MVYSDRFIPSRLSSNLADAFEVMDNPEPKHSIYSSRENQDVLNSYLRSEILSSDGVYTSPGRGSGGSSNVLKYKSPKQRGSTGADVSNASIFQSPMSSSSAAHSRIRNADVATKKILRKIPRAPYKILDAPNLQDDYYLNLVDWSSTNVVSVALGSSVYLWSAHTAKAFKLCDVSSEAPMNTVTSVTWSQRGNQCLSLLQCISLPMISYDFDECCNDMQVMKLL